MRVQSADEVYVLLQSHRDRIRSLGVKRLGLFGSFVQGEPRPESDVDIWVEFEEGQKTFDNFMALLFLLEDLFQRRVELVTPESLKPRVRPYIEKEVKYVLISG